MITQMDKDFSNLYKIYTEFKKNAGSKFKPFKTGFDDLDAVLGGGLTPALIILGGMPGIGKSTLALQIAVNVAEENPVLYFSLEMPGDRLMAKAITRKIYEIKKRSLCFTADDLLQWSLTENQQEKVETMMQDQFLDNLYVCTKPLTASEILERSRAFTAQEKTTPLVVIDYLQLLPRHRITQSDNDDKSDRNDNSDKSDKQIVDSNIYELMNLAHGVAHGEDGSPGIPGVPVILLSSLNRTAYSTGRSYGSSAGSSIQISSFKETGGIEYTADLLLGLQLRAVGMKGFDSLSELSKNPRNVELVVLKNRYGRSGDKIRLRYDSEYDCFFPPDGEEEAEDNTPDTSDTQPADQAAESQKPQKDGIKAILNSTKVADEIRRGKSVGKCLILTDRDTGKKIYTSYALSNPLSSLDLCVADAIYTLDHFQKKFSLRTILQVLQGIKDVNLTSEKKTLLTASIERLRTTELELNCQDHLAQINGTAGAWDHKGPFLRLDEPDGRGIYHRSNSIDDKAGILPLCTYAAAVKHIYTIPSCLLDINVDQNRRMSFSQDNICLKWALIHRLETLRSMLESRNRRYNPDSKRIISFDPDDPKKYLLEEVRPAQKLNSQQIGRLHTSTKTILNYYQNIAYIEKFEQLSNEEIKPVNFNILGKIKNPFKLNSTI